MKKITGIVLVPAVLSLLLVVGLGLATLVPPDTAPSKLIVLGLVAILAGFLGIVLGNMAYDHIKIRRNRRFLDRITKDFDKALESVRKEPPC